MTEIASELVNDLTKACPSSGLCWLANRSIRRFSSMGPVVCKAFASWKNSGPFRGLLMITSTAVARVATFSVVETWLQMNVMLTASMTRNPLGMEFMA